ncbi:hypothetical protein H6S82_10285 [Planktothrix sp. FACHB-1355]|uniref:Uncharacterized protein n=1 Tax=Aerosakkonema funiforme FACHB-1375 TaxID=2949571 RepID=A0A926VFZ4_9CYAN|nr:MULTISPECIES: hypothetical protein [Oscillatoriales]MBD2182970.1 hypothetical protein [Aerosakkonema funiforme FACHB-1375]MBD3559247.1 hypothetical protein [Planktothrix sp. FACHB-1355]
MRLRAGYANAIAERVTIHNSNPNFSGQGNSLPSGRLSLWPVCADKYTMLLFSKAINRLTL